MWYVECCCVSLIEGSIIESKKDKNKNISRYTSPPSHIPTPIRVIQRRRPMVNTRLQNFFPRQVASYPVCFENDDHDAFCKPAGGAAPPAPVAQSPDRQRVNLNPSTHTHTSTLAPSLLTQCIHVKCMDESNALVHGSGRCGPKRA